MDITTIGQCIYCRKLPTVEDPLSDEHILPFSIYGKHKLGRASCRDCAAITSAFEGKVMQDLASVRHVLNFPTRHKQRRKKVTLPVEIVTTKGEKKTIYVPPSEYFPLIALPAFDPPAHVSKKEYESGIQLIGVSSTPGKRSVYQERLNKFARDHGAKEIVVYSVRFPTEWGRMFAKAAYAFAVQHYGLEKVPSENVYVVDAILGKSNDIGRWVGGIEISETVFGDEFNDQALGLWEKDGEIHVVIKLFAFINTVPEYHVVVGKVPKADFGSVG